MKTSVSVGLLLAGQLTKAGFTQDLGHFGWTLKRGGYQLVIIIDGISIRAIGATDNELMWNDVDLFVEVTTWIDNQIESFYINVYGE